MSDPLTEEMRTRLKRWKDEVEARRKAADDLLAHINDLLKNLENQPNLADLRAEAARISANGSSQRSGPATQYDQITAYFTKVGNKPKTMREIAEETGISQKSLPSVLYTSHKDSFERRNVEGFKNRLVWCLTQAAYDAARG